MKRKTVFFVIVGFLVVGAMAYYWMARPKSLISLPAAITSSVVLSGSSTTQVNVGSGVCLTSNEVASYSATRSKGNPDFGTVVIDDKSTGVKISNLQIENVISQNYHDYELHPCGLYVVRQFNFNESSWEPLPGFSVELWKYDYSGKGNRLFVLEALQGQSTSTLSIDYSYDFRVSPNESFIALERGYQGSSDYALVIKDLNRLSNVFVLPVSDIAKQNPNIIADLGFEVGGWSIDGRYFWFSFAQGANTTGFVRVDSSNWAYQTFAAPITTMGGDAFNPDTGMVTYRTNAAPWTGSSEIDQQYRDQAMQSGKISLFYIYNLLTKQSYLVATTTDPTYYYQPKWISDSVLQYTPPSGVTTTYTILQ